MDKEELKNTIDFNKIIEVEIEVVKGLNIKEKVNFMEDDKGNKILMLTPLEFKLIEKINDLEERIKTLEEK